MGARLRTLAAALVAALVTAACIYTPLASPQQDTLAKEFLTFPNASTIYVYRSPYSQRDVDTVLYLDGRIVGMTQPGAYYRVDTTPGAHTLHGTTNDVGQLMLDTRPGQIYFVSLDVIGGHSSFSLVPEEAGRERVRACCALLENAVTPRGAVVR